MPYPTGTPPMTIPDWTKRVVQAVTLDANGCWNWTGSIAVNGYGNISVNGGRQYTHRVAYTTIKGPIPDGLHIDHLCRNRACCNPDHLEAVTQRVNTMRGDTVPAAKAQQTHCIHGHEFDAINTYTAPNGTRKCRPCRAQSKKAAYYRAKAAA